MSSTLNDTPKILSTILRKSSVRTWRPLHPPLSANIEVDRTNELEHRIVLDSAGLLASELVAVEKLRQENLDLLESKVEADAHPLASCERNVCGLMSVLDPFGVPAIGIEAVWVVPELRKRVSIR
jgi:hypothetical protein